MDQSDEMFCKLCLQDIIRKNSHAIGEVILKALAFLSLNVNLDERENCICNDCSAKLFAAFDFKKMCLNTEDRLLPYIDRLQAGSVDLRDIFLKIKGVDNVTVTSIQQICGLCMCIVVGGFKSLRELCHENMVQKYIPEVNFSITKDPVVCKQCWNSLNTHIDCLRQWMDIEKKMKIQTKDSDVLCIKSEEIDLKFEEDNEDGVRRNLPPSFKHASIGGNTYRANLVNRDDIRKWIAEYGNITSTGWIIRSCKNSSPRFVSCYEYYCHQTGYKRVNAAENKKGNSKNCNCKARIKIKIKISTKSTIRRDTFMKDGMPGIIFINDKHNHNLNSTETLSHLRPSKEIRKQFEEYFKCGYSIKQAISHHKAKLELQYGPESTELANGQINPKYRSVQFWFKNWRSKKLGALSTDAILLKIDEKQEASPLEGVTAKPFENPECREIKRIKKSDIRQLTDNIFSIPSEEPSQRYNVDVLNRFCGCDIGRLGSFCKHQAAVLHYYPITRVNPPKSNTESKNATTRLTFVKIAPKTDLHVPNIDQQLNTSQHIIYTPSDPGLTAINEDERCKTLGAQPLPSSSVSILHTEQNVSDELFDTLIGLLKGKNQSFGTSPQSLKRVIGRLKSINTKNEWEDFLNTASGRNSALRCKKRSVFNVQPSAVLRSTPGTFRGCKRSFTGRPTRSEREKKRK